MVTDRSGKPLFRGERVDSVAVQSGEDAALTKDDIAQVVSYELSEAVNTIADTVVARLKYS